MGPRSHERETVLRTAGFAQLSLLQWGRVLMNAETRVLEFRRRRDEMLQWGRVLMNAETWYLNLRTPRVRIASMGPRSHERGNIPPLWLGSRPCGSLQWGRVLMNAETRKSFALSSSA